MNSWRLTLINNCEASIDDSDETSMDLESDAEKKLRLTKMEEEVEASTLAYADNAFKVQKSCNKRLMTYYINQQGADTLCIQSQHGHWKVIWNKPSTVFWHKWSISLALYFKDQWPSNRTLHRLGTSITGHSRLDTGSGYLTTCDLNLSHAIYPLEAISNRSQVTDGITLLASIDRWHHLISKWYS